MLSSDLLVLYEPNTFTLFLTNNSWDRWWCAGHSVLSGSGKNLILPLLQDYVQPKEQVTIAIPETFDYVSKIGIYPFRVGQLYKGIESENLFFPDAVVEIVRGKVSVGFH